MVVVTGRSRVVTSELRIIVYVWLIAVLTVEGRYKRVIKCSL